VKLINSDVPVIEEEHSAHDRRLWEYIMSELMKTEIVLEGNLCNLFAVLMSRLRYQESSRKHEWVPGPRNWMDSIRQLKIIEKLVYTRCT